jgi:hypothetical protein
VVEVWVVVGIVAVGPVEPEGLGLEHPEATIIKNN